MGLAVYSVCASGGYPRLAVVDAESKAQGLTNERAAKGEPKLAKKAVPCCSGNDTGKETCRGGQGGDPTKG